MLKFVRKCHQSSGSSALTAGLFLAAGVTLAGCSADISRFDLGSPESARSPSYASGGTTGRTAASEYGSAGYDRSPPPSSVARSDLPPPEDRFTTSAIQPQQDSYGGGYDQGRSQQPSYGGGAAPSYGGSPGHSDRSGYGGQQQAAVPPVSTHDTAPSGDMIEVRPGDTLYGLSRRHGVTVNALKAANGLTSSDLKPGQKLYLPGNARAPSSFATARPQREDYDTAAAPVAPPATADAPSDWTGSYTVRQGDSLYAIARRHGVKLSDLERYNGIADSRRVMPGTVLRLPGDGSSAPVVADATPARAVESVPQQPIGEVTASPSPAYTPPAYTPPSSASTPQQPTLLNGAGGGDRVARAETPGTASDVVSPTASQNAGSVAGSSKLRWPVAGKVVSGFGPRPDGTHNDGVNLSAPMGTDIHAAEGGVVAYAGDELKGYGNLVLLRHDNGWVTAYAHADEILVKRGDRIKRGQVIAKVGRTGQVDQPQVHFELRQGQKPVDPSPFMERL